MITAGVVAELNAKRTQGKWGLYSSLYQRDEQGDSCGEPETLRGCSYDEDYYAVQCGDNVICDNAQFYPKEVQPNDTAFIAAAPDMAALIATQDAEIKRLRRALQWLYEVSIIEDENYGAATNAAMILYDCQALTKNEATNG